MAWLGFRCSGPTIYSQPHDTASNHAQLRTRAPRVSDLYLGCTSNFSFQRIQYMRGHGARSIISLAFLLTHCMITCQALLHYKSSKLIHTPPFPSHLRSSLTAIDPIPLVDQPDFALGGHPSSRNTRTTTRGVLTIDSGI